MIKTKNSLFNIAPYKLNGVWMYDDKERGILKEPFVEGADSFLDLMSYDGKGE